MLYTHDRVNIYNKGGVIEDKKLLTINEEDAIYDAKLAAQQL